MLGYTGELNTNTKEAFFKGLQHKSGGFLKSDNWEVRKARENQGDRVLSIRFVDEDDDNNVLN